MRPGGGARPAGARARERAARAGGPEGRRCRALPLPRPPAARASALHVIRAGRAPPRRSRVPTGRRAPDPEVAVAAEAPGGMGESIPLAAPVPVEQAVLETFFSHLGIFSYDKAKDNVEKEREANKSAGSSWLALLAGLAHLAAAEKAYHSMTFLGQKLGTASGREGPALPTRPAPAAAWGPAPHWLRGCGAGGWGSPGSRCPHGAAQPNSLGALPRRVRLKQVPS